MTQKRAQRRQNAEKGREAETGGDGLSGGKGRDSLRRKTCADVAENSLKLTKDNNPKSQCMSKSRHITMKLEEKRSKEKILISARGKKLMFEGRTVRQLTNFSSEQEKP